MPRRRLTVARNAVYVNGDIVGTPKTYQRRSVPFPEFLTIPLSVSCRGKTRDDLLFPDSRGGFMITPTTRENSRHDPRHTAASLAISSGANVKAVKRMLGHASAAMTLDTYGDLFDDDLDAVAVALGKAAAESSVGKMWANSPVDE